MILTFLPFLWLPISEVGLTASFFGLGATLSNFLGQMIVEHFGHVTSLMGSLVLSIAPILLFSFMPETHGHRGDRLQNQRTIESNEKEVDQQSRKGYQSIEI